MVRAGVRGHSAQAEAQATKPSRPGISCWAALVVINTPRSSSSSRSEVWVSAGLVNKH